MCDKNMEQRHETALQTFIREFPWGLAVIVAGVVVVYAFQIYGPH